MMGAELPSEEDLRELCELDDLALLIAAQRDVAVLALRELRAQLVGGEGATASEDAVQSALRFSTASVRTAPSVLEDQLREFRDRLHDAICVDGMYCANSRRIAEWLALLGEAGGVIAPAAVRDLATLLGEMAAAASSFLFCGVPLSLLIYLIRKYLDRFCDCG